MNDILGILLLLLLVLLNAFFVAAEFAIVKVRGTRVTELAAEGGRRARVAEHLVSHLDAYLSATQLGITMASLGLGWVGEPALAHLIEPPLDRLGLASPTTLHAASAVLAFAVITFLHIVIGELAPKSVAIRKAEATSLWVAYPLRWFYLVFRPLIWLFNSAANLVLRAIHLTPANEAELAHSEEELRMILTASQAGGHIDEIEQALMRRALTFGERAVGEIMVPRTEMAGLPIDMSIANALEEVAVSNHTRYPVYEEDLDETIGYVHVKELYRADRTKPVRSALRPIGFISETASIEIALKRFQSTRTPLAIVVDEHGGTAGLVTIQDVVEELIGEVQDEFDHDNPLVEPGESDGTFSVDGGARIDYLEEVLGLVVLEAGFPTLGGRVFEQLQRRPRVGDEVEVGNFCARVLEVDGLRITRVLMESCDASEHADGNESHEDGSRRDEE
ncbi:MAG TPA: hemolysin family protein [Thermoleophilia bacterium]|nr:hemolysin family protein [Thermoleophilia bacterium]